MKVYVVTLILVLARVATANAQSDREPRPLKDDELGAVAWYDTGSGRMWISVSRVLNWEMRSQANPFFTGPDNPVDLGFLPAGRGLASADAYVISEASLTPFTYGPVDLGLVAPAALTDMSGIELRWSHASTPLMVGDIVIIPEPSALVMCLGLLTTLSITRVK